MNRRVAVFVSGNGANLQALLDQTLRAQLSLVVSSRARCQAVARAKRAGISTLLLSKESANWQQLLAKLNQFSITHIVLLGFMKIIPGEFLQSIGRPIFNLHPSLLPAFKGLNAIERSFSAKAPMGASFHKVTPELDAGAIFMQQKLLSENTKSASLRQAELAISFAEKRIVRRWGDLC
jgi:phosphoribosylglycinamide formyltransferase-1